MGKLFGTDGIRGIVGENLTVELAFHVGQAVAAVLTEEKGSKPTITIGKDTRISSDMLEAALMAGICSVGGDVMPLGTIPTPAVAYLTVLEQADAGIVISASHNPYEHNGIKVFNARGYKLSDESEARVEELILSGAPMDVKTHGEIGKRLHGMRQMKRDTSKELDDYRAIFKLLILTIAPIILSTTIYNSANVIDSAMFNKIMGAQGTSEAVCAELLGKLGQYYTLFNVPLAVASALGSSVIPGLVSVAENHDRRLLHNRIYTVIRYTMLIAIPSAFGFFALGQPIMDFLWPNVDNVTQGIMLKIGAISLVFYSLSTVTNTVLQGLDRMMEPVKNAMVSLILHIVSLFIMLVMFKWGIYALIGSKIVFSLCMCIMNAHDIREACGYLQESRKTFVIPSIAGAVMAILAWAVHFVLDTFIGGRIATLIALIVAVAVYAVVLLKMGGMSEKELLGLPKGHQIVIVCKKCHLLKERRYY